MTFSVLRETVALSNQKCVECNAHTQTRTHPVAPPFNLSVVSSRKLEPSIIAECLFRANWAITLLNHNH